MHFMDIYMKRWWIRFSAIAVLIIWILSLFVYGFIIYIKNAYYPPIIQSEADYQNSVGTHHAYVRINADEFMDLNIQYELHFGLSTASEKMENYIAVWVGNHILIIAVPPNQYDKLLEQTSGLYSFSGTHAAFDQKDYDDIKKLILQDNDITAAELNNLLLPTYLRIEKPDVFSWSYWQDSFLLTIALVVTYFVLMSRIRGALKSLEIYTGGLELACPIIDAELADAANVYRYKPLIVTQNYIISDSNRAFFVMPINELMWVFKRVGKRKLLGFIPVGSDCQAFFVFSDLRRYIVDMQDVDAFLSHLTGHSNVPVIGYNEEYARMYRQNRNGFIEMWKKGKLKRNPGTSFHA